MSITTIINHGKLAQYHPNTIIEEIQKKKNKPILPGHNRMHMKTSTMELFPFKKPRTAATLTKRYFTCNDENIGTHITKFTL